jgi:mevalonate kinase
MKQKKIQGLKVEISAPGKIILSGEHSVVYGHPALVASIDKRMYIDLRSKFKKEISIHPHKAKNFVNGALIEVERFLNTKIDDIEINLKSQIPIGKGLGSSAALAVVISAGLFKLKRNRLILKDINDLAYQMEKRIHGNPSGVDNTISAYGGFLWYRKETENLKTFSKIIAKRKLPKLLLIDTGRPQESTKQMVSLVSEFYRNKPRKVKKILENIELVTKAFLQYILKEKEFNLTEIIEENERFLEELGVVSLSTARLIREIKKIGGAAKITGAGGKKRSSGIIYAFHPNQGKLFDFIDKNGLNALPLNLGVKGVNVEKNS